MLLRFVGSGGVVVGRGHEGSIGVWPLQAPGGGGRSLALVLAMVAALALVNFESLMRALRRLR